MGALLRRPTKAERRAVLGFVAHGLRGLFCVDYPSPGRGFPPTTIEIAPIEQDHASPSRAKRMRYWAFGAVCRSNCAFVLHGLYDTTHRDHFHTDNMTGVAFNRHSEATVKLLQAVLKDIHGHNIDIDGKFGSESLGALTDALVKMNLSGGSIDNVETWRRFLRRSARVGFVRSLNV